jgi:transcriptional regulator of acetoin/glycerol metabolism
LRELHNVISYASSLCSDRRIELHDLPDEWGRAPSTASLPVGPSQGPVNDDERALRAALKAAQWNVTAVARQLQLSRMTLYRRMKRWGITAPHRLDGASDSD